MLPPLFLSSSSSLHMMIPPPASICSTSKKIKRYQETLVCRINAPSFIWSGHLMCIFLSQPEWPGRSDETKSGNHTGLAGPGSHIYNRLLSFPFKLPFTEDLPIQNSVEVPGSNQIPTDSLEPEMVILLHFGYLNQLVDCWRYLRTGQANTCQG